MDSIIKIKEVVNSLEAGIKNEDANAITGLLSGLKGNSLYQGDAATLVKMMQSTSRYLVSKTDTAHPDTVPFLSALANDLEILVSEPGKPKAEVHEILGRNILFFKSLKAKITASSPLSDSEIEEIKAVILSVDWEISNITLKSFDQTITKFKKKLRSNKLHYTFLKIIHSVGGYIAQNKAGADINSIKLLRSVYLNYEKLIQNPGLPMEEKKLMIESDIRAYNEFKNGLARWAETNSQQALEDDDLPPALSHIHSTPATRRSSTLSTLPAESSEDGEEMLPALPGRKKKTHPKDVMGDLFSPKASPADELLDEIHRAEFPGPKLQSPVGMVTGSQGEEENPGVKKLYPQRGGQAPIPEIESRLDEFFNFAVSKNSTIKFPEVNSDEAETVFQVCSEETEPEANFFFDEPEPVQEGESTQEHKLEPESDLAMEMLPDDGIELIESAHQPQEQNWQDQSLLMQELKDDPAEPVLERLKALLNAPAELAGESIFTKALEDLSQLEQLWDTHTDKALLVELLTGLTRYIHDLTVDHGDRLDGRSDGIDLSVAENLLEGENQNEFSDETALPAEKEVMADETDTLETEKLADGNDLPGDKSEQKNKPEENRLEKDEDLLKIENTPKGFWRKIKSKLRK